MSEDHPESEKLRRQIQSLQLRIGDLENSLLASEKNFRNLTDSAPVGIYLDDAQGRATYINKKCAELVGVPAEQALNFDWISRLHPDDRDRMVSEWKRAFENSAPFRLEYRWVHADGKVVWTLGEVVPILGDDGKATMFIGTLTDITARKEAELEKEALKARLIQAQKLESIGRLAGGVAHDYNNMLGAIVGFTELAMIDLNRTGPAYEKLKEIHKAAKRSTEVTRQLLSFARKQVAQPTAFDVNEAVQDMLTMLQRLSGEHITLTWRPEHGTKSVMMDRAQFDQAVVNLCINARDAIDGAGQITLETRWVSFDQNHCANRPGFMPGEFVLLSISDDGHGMDTATLENIFEPFFTTKADKGGTGLGLASVYGTVKQHGGFIDVRSKVGAGTTLGVYLPAHHGAIAESTPADQGDLTSKGETVLIVEDEKAILELVSSVLKSQGYNVLSASSPTDALNLGLHYHKEIHLLITDVIMPGMNGRDVASQLQSKRPNLKCLYMSGYSEEVIADKGFVDEKLNFISKPFGITQLIQKIRAVLGNHPI